MLVFKFGGASVKSAKALNNVINILKLYSNRKIVVVVSAMGKTTNKLESLFEAALNEKHDLFISQKDALYDFHIEMIKTLFSNQAYETIKHEIDLIFDDISAFYQKKSDHSKSQRYDAFISFGEHLSSLILQFKIDQDLKESQWSDARKMIKTDDQFQKANVDWQTSIELIKTHCLEALDANRIIVTQGFVSSNALGETTTLGREGSDYSAGIFAHALDAESVTIWKDVPGMLNADPKFFEDTQKLDRISFREAIELSYYGASVIHPKTLKPLQNKKIPLYVKSFMHPTEEGTTIDVDTSNDHMIPSFIFKKNQVLFSITPKDFSFLIEANLGDIFLKLSEAEAEINIMQNSALSFSFLVDYNANKIESIIKQLSPSYEVKYNTDLELVTVRHYDKKTNNFVCKGKKILLQQRTRKTARFVLGR
ncbi:MAG: aspartate kinase [Cryomorphaceae bacterium]|nr:aspartate kinase [Cryomorphaceae bacterium]